MKRSGIVIATLLLTVASALAAGADAPKLNSSGLADACTSCHGIDGKSHGAIPSIGGLDRTTIVSLLHGFRDGKGNSTIMNRIARGYTDAEIEALADYFSSVRK